MRILVWGLKENIGGVENSVINFLRHFDKDKIVADVLVRGSYFAFEKEVKEFGGKVIYMPKYLPNIKAYAKALDKVFEEEKYDTVWCHFSGLTNIEVLKKAKKYNVPIRVAHSHVTNLTWASDIVKPIVIFLHYVNKTKLSNYATDYWCCTEGAGKFMFPQKVWDKLTVVKDAIELDRYTFNEQARDDIRAKYGIKSELVVGHVGRFTRAKNQKFLLDIFKDLLEKDSTAKLLFVAEGELGNEIKSYAQQLGVINNVIFTGHIDDVSKYYSAMDVFLLPSLFEGLGMVLIEAQAAGTPCIASTNVPLDTKLTEGIKYLDNNSPKEWTELAIEMSKKRIENPIDSIKAFGYDIAEEAKRVQSLFER